MPKKIMNLPEDCVSEAMEGFLAANKDYVQVEGASAIRVRNLKDKPAMIVGGGSGHEPMFGYFVGENLADASVAGSVFTSPDPGSILQAAQAVDRGKGILFVYGNYSGDNMNFDIAGEMLGDMDIPVKTVRVWDDVASASKENYLGPPGHRRQRAGSQDRRAPPPPRGWTWRRPTGWPARPGTTCTASAWASPAPLSPARISLSLPWPTTEMEYGLGIHGEPASAG